MAAHAHSDLPRLKAWLEDNASSVGDTVLMPLREGEKSPMFAHKGAGQWTAHKAAHFMAEHPTHQYWGLLLDRNVVLDADDADAVAWLEWLAEDGTAPLLKRCPAQATRKGQHYFMLRSAEADEQGFYDGARQASGGKNVDFKTLCSTGTRGALVVSPTPGKTWLPGRAPWDSGVELLEAPVELLQLVATPKKGSDALGLKAKGGTEVAHGSGGAAATSTPASRARASCPKERRTSPPP